LPKAIFALISADSRQQTADSRQQTADSRQQTADSRQQTANYTHNLKFNVNYTLVYIPIIKTLLCENSAHKFMRRIFYINIKMKGETK